MDEFFSGLSSTNEWFLLIFYQKLEKRAKMDFGRICFYLIHWLKWGHDKFGIRRLAPAVVFIYVVLRSRARDKA